ncbi:MAG: hypothetical protein M0Z58_03145 [Nitrospiraceae bacterium]|nr:hypothetical protein [Nitrospiraceae bacterium]
MKNLPLPLKVVIPVAILAAGLAIGLGIGQVKINKESRVFEYRMKEVSRKITLMQNDMAEQETETAATMQQERQSDQDKLGKLESENKALAGQVGKLKAQAHELEIKTKQDYKAFAGLRQMKRDNSELARELKKATTDERDLRTALKKTAGQKQTLQAELNKTTRDLGRCVSENASLCRIAADLVKKYRDKGLGSVLLESEPLTQIKRVELEHLTRKYRKEIEDQKIREKSGGASVSK